MLKIWLILLRPHIPNAALGRGLLLEFALLLSACSTSFKSWQGLSEIGCITKAFW